MIFQFQTSVQLQLLFYVLYVGSFKFLLYFYFGNIFVLMSVFISVSGFSMLDTESVALML